MLRHIRRIIAIIRTRLAREASLQLHVAHTGRLVFFDSRRARVSSAGKPGSGSGGARASGLILLILCAESGALDRYLLLHRTECVDVDSRGRKVRYD
jgi:hypothetical protein